jgi:hypothetical protein
LIEDARRSATSREGDQYVFGDGTEEKTSEDGADDRSGRHGEREALVGVQDFEAAVAAVAGERHSMVGKEIVRARLPAILVSTANSSTTWG